jgi:hypothetical protein
MREGMRCTLDDSFPCPEKGKFAVPSSRIIKTSLAATTNGAALIVVSQCRSRMRYTDTFARANITPRHSIGGAHVASPSGTRNMTGSCGS